RTRRVLAAEVRGWRTPRSARARNRGPGPHPYVAGHRERTAEGRRGGRADQGRRSAGGCVSGWGPRWSGCQYDRLGRAPDAPTDWTGGHVSGRTIAAQEQSARAGSPAIAALRHG